MYAARCWLKFTELRVHGWAVFICIVRSYSVFGEEFGEREPVDPHVSFVGFTSEWKRNKLEYSFSGAVRAKSSECCSGVGGLAL